MLSSISDAPLTALLLLLLALTVLGLVLYKALRLEKAQYDPEAQTPTRHLTLVPAPPGVGWMPQIRSISCSTPAKGMDKKHPARTGKASSGPLADSTLKSVPPRELILDDEDLPQSNESCSPLTSPLIPRALAVSGTAQARCS
ncbi:hypothetical protein BKA83DRAFT_4162375 [Pisolithus microcarpus]|nr:hypothetical protein BKA83DRAFT_4162375 [Pisolithus microcarpus]